MLKLKIIIKIISQSEDSFEENNEENYDQYFNVNNIPENMNDNYDLCNIKNKSFSNFMNDIKNKNAIDLFLISPKN